LDPHERVFPPVKHEREKKSRSAPKNIADEISKIIKAEAMF
jgi:hypothetical protein